MERVYVVYMNYCSCCVFQYSMELKRGWTDEDVETWLEEHTSYDRDDCCFMARDEHIEMYDGS